MDKILVNIMVPSIDNSFSVKIPINLEMSVVANLIQKTIVELSDNAYVIKESIKLYDRNTGYLINTNNIVKFSGLKNGSSILLL